MSLNRYRYVIAVSEHLSISRAAQELYITQPALTKYLNKLEEELGLRLFDRTVNPIRITYAGEVYIREGRRILELQRRLDQQLSEIAQMQRGRLTIGINSDRGSWSLPILVPLFRERYPHVELNLQEGHSRYLEEEILKNHIDVAIGTLPVREADIDYLVLSDEPIVLAVPAEHPIARRYDLTGNSPQTPYLLPPEWLNGQDMILLVEEQGMGRVARQLLRSHNLRPNVVMTLKNNTTALRMASAGLGMVFALADTAARADLLKPMAWFTLSDPVFCRQTIAYYHASFGLSPLAKEFVELWRERMGRDGIGKGCRAVAATPREQAGDDRGAGALQKNLDNPPLPEL